MKFDVVIFISGAWPGKFKGYEIANLSTLEYFSSKAKYCLYFGPSEQSVGDECINRFTNCSFIPVNFDRKSKSIRFLKTLFSKFPAITERFWGESEEIISIIEMKKKVANEKVLFFYEDIPSAYLLFNLKNKYQDSQHYVRSHNVVYKGFYGMSHQKNLIMNLLWTYELNRIKKFEKKVFDSCDAFYSISEDDSEYYREKMQIYPSGSTGFFLDNEYYKESSQQKNNLLFLGTADLRKGRGLKKFISITWPIVRQHKPNIHLFIAGKNTETFHDPKSGIHAFGFISDEHSFFEKGNIFINPQTEGAGIKIKSVVALAKTKTLVTTSTGAEGIGVRNKIHCMIEDDFVEQASIICELLENRDLQIELATRGYRHVNSKFSKNTFFKQMSNLVNAT